MCHLDRSLGEAASMPGEDQSHNTTDVKDVSLCGFTGHLPEEIAELLFFVDGVCQHSLCQQQTQGVLFQSIQKGCFFFPVAEKMCIKLLGVKLNRLVWKIIGSTVKNRMIDQRIKTAIFAAE